MKLPSLLTIITGANATVTLASKLHSLFKKVKEKTPEPEKDGIGDKENGGGNTEMGTGNGILGWIDDHGGTVTGKKLEKKEIAEMRRKQVERSLIDIGTQRILMGQNVERVLMQARKKGVTPGAKRALYIKWRISQQQYDYLNTMYENLEMIQARMQISDMTVEFGQAIENATAVIRQNNKETPDFDALMKKFNKQIAPVNEMIGQGLENMTKALLDVELPAEGLYSESSFEAAIRGEQGHADAAEGVPFPPVEATSVNPTSAPTVESQKEDLGDVLRQLANDLEGK